MFPSADLLRNCVFAWALSDSFRLSGSIILLASFNLLAITSAASFKSKQTHWRNQGTRISRKIGRFLTIGISQEITRVLSMDIWWEFRRVLTSGMWIYGDILGKACLLFIFLSVAFLFSFGTANDFRRTLLCNSWRQRRGFIIVEEDETWRVRIGPRDQPHSSPGIRSVYICHLPSVYPFCHSLFQK